MSKTWRRERTDKEGRRPLPEHGYLDNEGDYRDAFSVEEEHLPPIQKIKHGYNTKKGKRK